MKKQLVIATSAALLTTSAWATKARMQALGQDTDYGSEFIKDSRNVFRNAANINSMKNYVVTEWGTAAATASSATAPGAEGGFFREAGNFTYGLYLGSDLESQNGVRKQASAGGYAGSSIAMGHTGALARDNELDLFFGGDMGIEWGARLTYAKGKDQSGTPSVEETQSSMGLGLGMVMGDLEVYANLGLKDEVEKVNNTTGAKWEADTGIVAGGSYKMGDYSFFGSYTTRGAEYVSGTGVAKNETSQKIIYVGAGHTKEVSATSRVFTSLAYKNSKAEDKDGTTATNNTEVKASELPFSVGFEADATSWLTLRGSISQNLFLNNEETKTTSTVKATKTNNTDVAAGATLNFGKLKVDGMIGTNGANGSTAGTESGVLDLDRLMTRVAVHYWF